MGLSNILIIHENLRKDNYMFWVAWNYNFNTPRLLHLYDGGGPPLERGLPQKADY
jgi:hypothetical protein